MKDILLDKNGELQVQNSDIVIDEGTQQSVHYVIISQKGEFKAAPSLGFGIDGWLKRAGQTDNVKQAFKRDLEVELRSVGYGDATVTTGDSLLNFDVDV
jgi:hypothetical protein